MPAVLTGRLTDTQWNQFCDDLDEALKPAAKMRKVFLAGIILIPIIFIIFGAISFISFATAGQKQFDNFPNNTSSSNDFLGSFIFFIIGGVVLFVGFGILTCVMIKSKNSISSGLRKVCDQYSARLPGVSFHVRYESRLWSSGYSGYHSDVHVSTTEYIEVYVAPSDTTTNVVVEPPIAQAIPVPVPSAPTLTDDPEVALGGGRGGEKKSAAERMRELDRMKGLLTEDEYQRKRAEIMSDV